MKHWRSLLIAMTSALAGAALTQLASSWEQTSQPLDAGFAPEPELDTEARSGPQLSQGSVQRDLKRIETKETPPRSLTFSTDMGKLAGQDPASMLTFEQKKTLLRHRYGALFHELALTPSETERLLGVLSDQESRSPSRARRERAGTAPVDEAESNRVRAELAQAIGSTKATAFEQLRGSLPARSDLRRLRDQLEEAGEPMTSEQHRALIDIVSAQTPETPPSPGQSKTLEAAAERYRTWVSDRERNLRQNAAAVLTEAQLQTLDEGQELREAMRPQLGSASMAVKAQAGSGG